jgi:hypothetical protein
MRWWERGKMQEFLGGGTKIMDKHNTVLLGTARERK